VTGVTWAGAGHETVAGGVRGTARPTAPSTAPHTAAAVPAPVPVATGEWAATLARLDRDRSRAFARGDRSALAAVYAEAAPALARDRAALDRLTAAGLRADGLRLTATSVALAGRTGDRVRLAVTDLMPAYRLVDAGGSVVDTRPGRDARSWTVVLARAGGGWRVYDVVRG
jgi:hypothetical protein